MDISKVIDESGEMPGKRAKVWSDGRLNMRLEQRVHERYSSRLEARFFYGNRVYTGKVTDISEGGVFINSEINFPRDYVFDIILLLNKKVVKMSAKVSRRVGNGTTAILGKKMGMGVQLLAPSEEYRQLIDVFKTASC
ncbi:MAG: PilZ domain-containing protein [Nitrospira sp.]|nr:PilZ domain-containing protein [bacterium]MBL7050196.1 PilZ domain-containing protein [Nitrospira sp.]